MYALCSCIPVLSQSIIRFVCEYVCALWLHNNAIPVHHHMHVSWHVQSARNISSEESPCISVMSGWISRYSTCHCSECFGVPTAAC